MFKSVSFAAALVASTSANFHDEERQAMIEAINKMEGVKWQAGHNERFASLPVQGSMQRLCGVHSNSTDILDQAVRDGKVVRKSIMPKNGLAIPVAFDSATQWPECAKVIGDIRDQSNCGCCWAFAAAEAASDRLCIATKGKTLLALSAQDECFCASSDGCNGGDVFTPWQYLQSTGLVTGGQFNETGPFPGLCADFTMPHCHHHGPQGNDPYPDENAPGCPSQTSAACPTKCGPTAIAPHDNFGKDKHGFDGLVMNYPDVTSIQTAIMEQGPVEAAFLVYADFANYVSGVYHHVSGDVEGGHAIKLVGWGVDAGTPYWRVANSWNPYWGEQGYFRILRGTNECDIEKSVTANAASAKWH